MPNGSNITLNSWKEIAAFLGRGVRTVQRWEREQGFPVRRVRRTEHSPVFAYVSEVEAWLASRPALAPQRPAIGEGELHLPQTKINGVAERTVRRSQHLICKLSSLVIEQRGRAKTLAQNLEATVAGINQWRKRRATYNAERTPVNSV